MATPTTTDIATLLVVDPDYRQGRPCLRGTGITVHNVAGHYNAGATVDQMVESNPDLSPALFHAALAYYFANRERIDAEIDEDLRYGAELAAKYPNGMGRDDVANE
jgi:uncharacterized protein (DUF433 family)